MKTKYIIEVEDKPFELLSEDGFTSEKLYRVKGFNSLVFDWNGLNMLTPYTEPDMEKVREEAYEQGLSDAWECARKIADIPYGEEEKVFGSDGWTFIANHTAQEAIKEIRQYKQEKDRQARIEYNFDEVKDVIETTAKEYNMSLDEIAEVLKKMGEH